MFSYPANNALEVMNEAFEADEVKTVVGAVIQGTLTDSKGNESAKVCFI